MAAWTAPPHGRRARPGLHRRQLALPLAVLLTLAPAAAGAQTFQGRVLDELDGQPVSDARIRLIERDGDSRAGAISDSLGYWTLEAPEPGEYYLTALRPGYEAAETPLLAVEDEDGSYAIDLLLQRAPLGLPGLDVTVDRLERLEKRLRLLVGRSPTTLRTPPIMKPAIESHLARGHDLEDVVRWLHAPSLQVFDMPDGPCFVFRATGWSTSGTGGCATIYLNDAPLGREFTPVVPLDLAEVIVIVHPLESLLYPQGAILLYGGNWIG